MLFFKLLYNLYKENKELRKRNQNLFFELWRERYYTSTVATNYEGARGAMEAILKSETLENAKYYANIGLRYMNMRKDVIDRKRK